MPGGHKLPGLREGHRVRGRWYVPGSVQGEHLDRAVQHNRLQAALPGVQHDAEVRHNQHRRDGARPLAQGGQDRVRQNAGEAAAQGERDQDRPGEHEPARGAAQEGLRHKHYGGQARVEDGRGLRQREGGGGALLARGRVQLNSAERPDKGHQLELRRGNRHLAPEHAHGELCHGDIHARVRGPEDIDRARPDSSSALLPAQEADEAQRQVQALRHQVLRCDNIVSFNSYTFIVIIKY